MNDGDPKKALELAIAVAVLGSLAVWRAYGGAVFWPGLLGNFAATLAAFVVALRWENWREARQRASQDDEAFRQRLEQDRELGNRRQTEVVRRLEGVKGELALNAKSLDDLKLAYDRASPLPTSQIHNPQLLDGAWTANASRLAELLADYDLTSTLGITYGRIEELRWRLRQRTAAHDTDLRGVIGEMSRFLVYELVEEVRDVLRRIDQQISNPDVQPVGLVYADSGTVVGRGAPGSTSP